MGFLADIPLGFPGYHARLPKTAAALPRLLRDAGYSTMAVGKWHLTPRWHRSAAGPFDTWPLGLGFERYYGFLQGDTNHWTPNLICDNHYIDPPRRPDEGYHLSEDLADQAIRMVQDQQQGAPGKPFFLYFALGRHARAPPRHARSGWIRTGASSIRAGTPGARACSTGRWRAACPGGNRADAPARVGTGLGRPLGGRAAHAGPPAGGLRRLPHPHRRTDRPGRLRPRDLRAHGQHHGPRLLRQRGERRGGQGRQHQRAPLHRARPRVARGEPRALRRLGRVHHLQPLLVGLGLGRQHAPQALEALHLARRHPDPAHPPLARTRRPAGDRPPPVQPRHRPAAHDHGGGRARGARRGGRRAPNKRSTGPACCPRSTTPPPPRSTTRSTSR